MIESQPIVETTPESLVAKVREMHEQCYRLVQIGATPCKEIVEVNYSFDRDGRFTTLRVCVPAVGGTLPSVSEVYWCAFIYENELHDLFKIQVTGNVIDYKGEFYRMSVPFPYAPTVAPAQPPALAAPGTAGAIPAATPVTSPAPSAPSPASSPAPSK
jgi:ech hydrogenase subunit D